MAPDRTTIDQQIQALWPLDARRLALLAGYQHPKQFTDYRAKRRAMSDERLEKLARTLERLAATARAIKSTPTENKNGRS